MREGSCERHLKQIALGMQSLTAETKDHLRSCSSCRGEALRIGWILEAIAHDAEPEVPEALDRQVRRLLLAQGDRTRAVLRPRLAVGYAIVAVVAGICALIGFIDGSEGLSEKEILTTFSVVWIYFAVCCAATLPLLIPRMNRRMDLRFDLWPNHSNEV